MSFGREAVERPDDLHLQVLREARGLGAVALPEHDDRPRDVAARRVADRSDRVAERAHAVGALRRGSAAAVAVQDDDGRLGARQLRLGSRHGLLRLRDGRERLGLGRLLHVLRHGIGEQGDSDDDQHHELQERDRRGDEGGSPPRGVHRRKRVLHGRLVSRRRLALLHHVTQAIQIPRANAAAQTAPSAANVNSVASRARGRSSVSDASARNRGKSARRKRGRLTSGKPSAGTASTIASVAAE